MFAHNRPPHTLRLIAALDENMKRLSGTFTLTAEGKLPKGSSIECNVNGIYALIVDEAVVRFGESGTGFERIRNGFNHQLYRANKKKNYHAYHFREQINNKKIEVRYYSVKGKTLHTPNSRRAVEAELAYQFRARTSMWPKYMVEIHFYNAMSTAQKKLVADILADLSI